MKTAVSIPDELFAEAEQLLGELGVSRSQLYARAIAKFLSRHDKDAIKEQINAVVTSIETDDIQFAHRAAVITLRQTEW